MNAVIGALRVVLGLDSAAFDKGLGQAQARAARFGASLKKGLLIASAAAATAGAAIGLAIKGALDEADEMSKMASKIGVPIEELSRLKYAADLSGVSIQGVGTSFKKLSERMVAAAGGNKAAAGMFSDIGISATNADGTLRSSSAVLLDVADKFAKMEDGAAKTALAVQLFGKSGLDMIPLLNGGSAALKAMTDEADALGLTISAETGKAAEQFNDNLSRLQKTVSGIVTQIAASLAPTLATVTDFLVQVSTAFRDLSPEMQSFISIGSALTVAMAALAIPVGLVAAGIAAIGWPILGVVAGITALTAAVVAFWPEIKAGWEWLGKFVDVMIRLHVEALGAVIKGFQQLGPAIVTALAGLGEQIISVFRAIPGQMMEIGGQIIDGLISGISSRFEALKAKIVSVGEYIPESIRNLLDTHSPSRVMHAIGQDIMTGLGDGMTSLQPTIAGTAAGVAGDVKVAFKGAESAGSSLASSFSGAFKSVLDGSKSVKDALKGLLQSFADMAVDKGFQMLLGGGGSGSSGGGIFGGIFGGIGSLLGFSKGGSIMPGGSSAGFDNQVVAFRKTPKEQVDIYNPRKANAKGGGGASDIRVWVDQDGNWQAAVQRIADERAQGATQNGIAAYDRQMPGRFNDLMERHG